MEVLKELTKKGVGMTVISHDNFFVDEIPPHRVIKIHRGEITYDKRT